MFNRNISASQIERTIRQPDSVTPDATDPDLSVALREFTPGTVLRVWYRLERDQTGLVSCIVVTARRERVDTPPRSGKKKRR